jgi:hypothetical protein
MIDRELRKYRRFYSPGHGAMSVLFVLILFPTLTGLDVWALNAVRMHNSQPCTTGSAGGSPATFPNTDSSTMPAAVSQARLTYDLVGQPSAARARQHANWGEPAILADGTFVGMRSVSGKNCSPAIYERLPASAKQIKIEFLGDG